MSNEKVVVVGEMHQDLFYKTTAYSDLAKIVAKNLFQQGKFPASQDLLEKEIKRAKMLKAADDYMVFLQNHPEEKDELAEWESADLQSTPQSKISKRKK